MRLNRFLAAALLGTTALSMSASAFAEEAKSLEAGFENPPQSARPHVWWHWMNGNISEEGIAKDMDWMQRVGIGGLQNFDANLNTPQIVDKRLVYMDDGWKKAFKFTAAEAEKRGLELAIAASPGWSETGGPWVPQEDGLKKLTWSETTLPGEQALQGQARRSARRHWPVHDGEKGCEHRRIDDGSPQGTQVETLWRCCRAGLSRLGLRVTPNTQSDEFGGRTCRPEFGARRRSRYRD